MLPSTVTTLVPADQLAKAVLQKTHLGIRGTAAQTDIVTSFSFDALTDHCRSATTVDGNLDLNIKGLNQVTGNAVVSSFIHRHEFPGYNHLVPAILIGGTEFAVAMYDVEHDIVAHVLRLPWRNKTALQRDGVFLLWLFLHHKLFLRPLGPAMLRNKSGLQQILEVGQSLTDFLVLNCTPQTSWLGVGYPQPVRTTDLTHVQQSEYEMNKSKYY